jgi:hypothetical protein
VAELELALDEGANEESVQPLVAEIVVVATEFSYGCGEAFSTAVEYEICRREDIAKSLSRAGVPLSTHALRSGEIRAGSLLRSTRV